MTTRPIRRPLSLRQTLALTLALIFAPGCATQRTYEFNAGNADQFQWDGRVRVTVDREPVTGPFLTMSERNEISRVELVGHHGRSIVVDLNHKEDRPVPRARVQPVGCVPDPILEGRIIDPCPGSLGSAIRSLNATETEEYKTIAARVQAHRFGELRSDELVGVCIMGAQYVETRYRFDENTIVRIQASGADGRILHVIVEGPNGQVLHEYAPLDLSVVEVPDEGSHSGGR